MGKTISFVKGKGSVAHNNRDFIAANVDKNRTDWNVTYMCQPLREAYDECFGAALKEYNDKQKRNDRKKDDYMNEIKNSKNGEKLFYENVVQIGKMTDTGVLDENGELSESAKLAMEVLDEYARTFQERNPNLYVFNSVLHMDEATPHLHIDYIPVAHGYKKGMSTRNSLTKAYQEMGIESAISKKDNETVHWQIKERAYLEELCHEKGIEIETIGIDRDNYTLPEYKAVMKAVEDKEAEIEILNTQIAETEAIINGFDNLKAENEDQIKEQEEYLKQVKEDVEKSQKQLDIYKERNKIKYIMIEGSTKNQKARTIKLSTDAIKVLKLIYKENDPSSGDEKIAITRTGKQNTTTNLEKRMETIYRDAGLGKDVSGLHIMRRTFATSMYEAGAGIKEIAGYIGDNEDTVERYYIAVRKKVIEGNEAIGILVLPTDFKNENNMNMNI